MANKPYENFFLANEIEDQYNSHLDLLPFATIDNSLVGVAGMKIVINRYSATNGTEKVTEGKGNTKTITATYTPVDYTIECAQNRFTWTDESAMKDPIMVLTGHRHMGTDMFNTGNDDIYGELLKTKNAVYANAIDFAAFADAVAMFGFEDNDAKTIFGFVNPKDVADLRKTLKDDLKYIEAFVRTGYIGTVAGVNLYTKKDATVGTIALGTKEAVTWFNKKGVELGEERDENTRTNTDYSRKYYVVALTNEDMAVKIIKGTAPTTSPEGPSA